MFKSLDLRNFLSFGAESPTVHLGQLSVLVGTNGSGKSNLIEAIRLLVRTPERGGVAGFISHAGGLTELSWKGADRSDVVVDAVLDRSVLGGLPKAADLRHRLELGSDGQFSVLSDERIENAAPQAGKDKPYLFFGYEDGGPMLNVAEWVGEGRRHRKLERATLNNRESILAQMRDPVAYPELFRLSEAYDGVRLYGDWSFGRQAPVRRPVLPDLPTGELLEDASNLPLVLNHLANSQGGVVKLERYLGRLSETYRGVNIKIREGTVQLNVREGDYFIPALRLSDGTLRYLSLLAILLNPEPSRCVVIEEPELGLHPDMMATLAELLRDASTRTQVIVTTHSAQLVDAFTEQPSVLRVCEKDEGGTVIQELDEGALKQWIGEYSLGELWTSGELGGTRW